VFATCAASAFRPRQLDDALQDVFLVALRPLDKYVEGTHGKAWLFAIALRVARNYRRGQQRLAAALARLRESGAFDRNAKLTTRSISPRGRGRARAARVPRRHR